MQKINILAFLFSLNIHTFPIDINNDIAIYNDSLETEKRGWGNCDPHTNGEHIVIQNFIKKGDIIIDAGAYIGEWSTLVLEHTHNHCFLHSFEPVPESFKELQNNLLQKACCYNLGLGKNTENATMLFFYDRGTDCSTLYERPILNDVPRKEITISLTSLDVFCSLNSINRINFLKIDTEGNEWEILQGANNLITNKKIDIIQFEYGGTYIDAKITLQEVYIYLQSKGYMVFKIVPDGLIHIPLWRNTLENYEYCNYLALLKYKYTK